MATPFSNELATSEWGRRLTIFYWIVVNPVPPDHARVATFSYTILAGQRNQSQVQHDLEMPVLIASSYGRVTGYTEVCR